jgi:hypothetical protein
MRNTRGAPDNDDEKTYELGDLELAPRPARLNQRGSPRMDDSPDLLDDGEAPAPLPGLHASMPSNDFSFDVQRGHEIVEPMPTGALPGVPVPPSHFDDHVNGPALELDLTGDKPPPVRMSMRRPASDPPGAARGSTPSPRVTRSGRPLDEERRARALADYGVAESGIDPARYLIHVGLRMVALRRARAPVEHRASELAEAYEGALKELGRALLNDQAVLAHEGLAERVLLVRTRQGELEKVQQDSRAAIAKEAGAAEQLSQQANQLRSELEPYQAAERQAEAVRAKAEAAVKRQRAKVQRAEIELRALSKASLPPPPERVQSIESERTQQQQELDGLDAALQQANAALGRARRELALRQGTLTEIERKQRQQESASRAQVRGHEASVARAEHALSAVLVGLAEAADAVGVAQAAHAQVARLRESELALDEVVDQLACYDRALRMYDREAVIRGASMWLGVLVALALLVYAL